MCIDHYIVMEDGCRAPLNGSTKAPNEKPAHDPPLRAESAPAPVRVCRETHLNPCSQQWVTVQATATGEMFTEPLPPGGMRRFIAANGIMKCRASIIFSILVSNLSRSRVQLQNGRVVANVRGITPRGQEKVLALDALSDSAPAQTEAQEESGPTVEDIDLRHRPRELHDWARAILRKHDPKWDEKIGTINATEHAIELQPGAKPVHQAPYWAGHRYRDFPGKEIARMLTDGVMRPSTSDWASPVALDPKGNGSLLFCVD